MKLVDSKWMMITPAIAKEWLERSKNPRPISYAYIQEYAWLMLNGSWNGRTSTPIGLDKNNNLVNGQHRLRAVVESGVTILQHVLFNTTKEEIMSFDQGKNRGQHIALGTDTRTISRLNAARKYASGMGNKRRIPPAAQKNWLNIYREALQFLETIEPKTPYDLMPVEAVVMRACHTGTDRGLLQSFLTSLRNVEELVKLTPNRRQTIDRLQRFLDKARTGSEEDRQELTDKTEYALWQFVNDLPCVKLNSMQTTPWPCDAKLLRTVQ